MASSQAPRFVRSLTAASDLSSSQYLFVKNDGSDGAVIAGGATGEIGAGFLNNAPDSGEATEIMGVGGGARGIAAATISGPQIALKADAAGKMTPVTTAGDVIVALSMEAAATDDKFEVEPVFAFQHV